MSDVPNKSSLSPGRRRLLEMMQALNFGRIEQLAVAGGEPIFHPPPKVSRELKFGAENGPRPELSLDDFVLKAEVRALFDAITEIGDGVIERIEVRHGLPFRMIVAERCGQ
ncbi:MAG: hypothetical protein GXY83_36140 [Rhodopirellula sp.]|nr:hypothetical protein [Rhodopirellula sp.]